MGESSDRVKQDIEETREELGRTIDQLVDRTSPARIADRTRQRMTDRLHRVRERVMGPAEQALHGTQMQAQQVSDRASRLPQQATEAARGAGSQARRQVEGSPLAAGLIALGAGMVAASLLPRTKQEQRLESSLQQQADPLVEQAREEAKRLGSELSDEATKEFQSAGEELRGHAASSAEHLKEDVMSSAQHVRDEASRQMRE
jgi:gas vesicle protein